MKRENILIFNKNLANDMNEFEFQTQLAKFALSLASEYLKAGSINHQFIKLLSTIRRDVLNDTGFELDVRCFKILLLNVVNGSTEGTALLRFIKAASEQADIELIGSSSRLIKSIAKVFEQRLGNRQCSLFVQPKLPSDEKSA